MDHVTCTMHSASTRFHIIYEDFELIADRDVLNAAVLRILETKTDARIDYLRKRYGIPADQMPENDLLWLNDITVRELERWSLRVRCKSSFGRALAEKRSNERHPRSLVELGYLRSRWIARRDERTWPSTVKTEVCQDEQGLFVHVLDGMGNYLGTDGSVHNATVEGYTVVVQQFLYCFEEVNAMIAALDAQLPPKPVRRWSLATKKASPAQKTTTSTDVTSDAAGNTKTITAVQGGTKKPAEDVAVFATENTTNSTTLSSNVHQCHVIDESLRTAAWTAETIIALSAAVLLVPNCHEIVDEVWATEWLQPAKVLLEATSALSPQLAWERIDLVMRYMVDATSPSWWRTGRGKQTPTTLRHVAAHIVDYYAAFRRGAWFPSQVTPYDGPPLKGPTSETLVTSHGRGMKRRWAEQLRDGIWERYPGVHLAFTPTSLDSERFYISIEVASETWIDIEQPYDFYQPTPELRRSIERAVQFAATDDSADSEMIIAMIDDGGGGQALAPPV